MLQSEPEIMKQDFQNCLICGSASMRALFDASDFDTGTKTFNLIQCESCRHVQLFPVLDDSELGEYYKAQYYGSGEKKFARIIEKWTQYSNLRLADVILKIYQSEFGNGNKPQSVLDIGCGRGNLLKAFRSHGFECHGVERTEFPEDATFSDIEVHKKNLQEIKFENNYFDIVVIWHVLEHLNEPVGIINEVSRILSHSGMLIIAVPNFGSIQSKLFGRYWFHLDLPRHVQHFTRSSLGNLLQVHNFKEIKLDTRTFDQSVFGFIQSALNIIPLFTPNSFYEQLKIPWKKRKLNFYLQSIIAMGLTPVALFEYLVSALSNRGCCLVLTSIKKTSS